jgi:hypothetical protein
VTEKLAWALLALFVLGVLFAPTWYRAYFRIRYGRPYVVDDSGR